MKLDINSNGCIKVVHFFAFCFSCLPSDLEGAVRQSGEAAGLFVSTGGMRATVCSRILFFFLSLFHKRLSFVPNSALIV